MINIPLQAIPNQSLSLQIDQITYDLRLHTCATGLDQITAVTLFINNVLILSGVRAVSGYPIIPYPYLENGNFTFVTMNDEYPNYTQFGITQTLVFGSQAEIDAIRTPPEPPVAYPYPIQNP